MKLPSFGPLTRSSLLACASLCATTPAVFAASQTWDGETDTTWATATNWVNNAVPGLVNPPANSMSGDTVTLNSALAGGVRGGATDPIAFENQRQVRHFLFDTANVGSYVIGTAGGNQLWLGHTGTVVMNAAVASAQSFASPVVVRLPSSTNGTYSITNNATAPAATLSFASLLSGSASSRPLSLTLGGSNTGENTIGGLSDQGTAGAYGITKTGAGKWVISGASTLTNQSDQGVTTGWTVNEGTLAVAHAAALGTNVAANVFGVAINNTGTLEIRNGVTVDNAVSLNLNNGGTLRAAGTSGTLGRINVGNAAATSVTINTAAAEDVFTIGNEVNDFQGGAADSVVHITGPGTVHQSVASSYLGSWSIDGGTLSLGSPTALGPAASASVVSIAGGAKLKTSGNNISVVNMTGTGTISNGAAEPSIVTLNNAGPVSFGGAMVNDGAGTLGLIKTGPGALNLAGASTYTDATSVTTGALNVTGSLGNTAVTVGTGATLSGNGTIAGGVTISSNARIAPGDGGDANLGTLTVGTLSLDPDAQLDFGITNTSTLDRITVTGSNGLTIQGGQLNINGGTSQFTTNGVYNLIGYSGTIAGNGVSGLSVNGLNKSVTKNYTFGTSGGFVTLSVTNSGTVQNFWNANADGNWSLAGNWIPGVPNAVGAFVGFGGGGTEITADRTITVNGSFTAGTLAFNGAANSKSYTLAAGTGAHLTLDNNLAGAFVTDTAGSHAINAPLTLAANGTTFTVLNAADTLSVGGAIEGAGNPLVKGGPGTLVLSGANTYLNGTTINAGTVVINSDISLGDVSNITTINAGTLRTTADVTSAAGFNLGDAASRISVAPGATLIVDGAVLDAATVGTLNKSDTGTLVLNNSNGYSGGTVINGGTVKINNAASLGNAAAGVTIHDAVLQATASFAGTRGVTLGNANSRLSADAGMTYTINGQVTGTGTLNKIGDGTVSLGSNTNNWSGGTILNAGILALNAGSFLGPGTVTFKGGTLQNNYGNNNTYGLGNPISIAAGQTGTINMNNRMGIGGAVSGSGTLNVNVNTTATRDDFSNSWTAFNGQLNIAGNGTLRLLNNGGNFDPASMVNLSMDLGGNAFVQSVTNSTGNTYSIGALSGSSPTAGFSGGANGRSTLSIGALNTNTSFAGQINGNSALIKVGTGTLTLAGSYNYTGNTTVNAGTLSLSTGTLSDTGTVAIVTGATLNLNFEGTDGVDEFSIDGVLQADGIYAAIDNGGPGITETAFITGTGRLEVLPDDPFATWIAQYPTLTGDDALKTADPDHDGLTNLEELALDGNPTSAADTGKVRAQIETVGTDRVLVMTLPVRNGAAFGGTPSKTATINEIIYTISGSDTLANPFDKGVTEIAVMAAGMPALNTGWSYRSFRLDGAIGGATPRGPVGFLRATVADSAP